MAVDPTLIDLQENYVSTACDNGNDVDVSSNLQKRVYYATNGNRRDVSLVKQGDPFNLQRY